MNVQVAISKRRSKKVAGGIVRYSDLFENWQFYLYGIVNETLAVIGMSPFSSREEAFEDANDTLKVKSDDWLEMSEDDAEQYIFDHATNRWKV